jgi:hypothetical protein
VGGTSSSDNFPRSLQFLCFESGSRLSRIEGSCFQFTELFFFFIPAGLELFPERSPYSARPLPVVLDPRNRHFTIVDRALMDAGKTTVIHYFGDSEVIIDSEVEILAHSSFASSPIKTITFAEPSRLRVIGPRALADCEMLRSIFIPSTVQVIAKSAFADCRSLHEVVFGIKSQLRVIKIYAFSDCPDLQSVYVPSNAKLRCNCTVYETVTDEYGSKLIRVVFG